MDHPYASVDDVEDRMGRTFAEDERRRIAVLLGDAETILRSSIPDLDERIADDDSGDYLKRVVMVEANMVARILRNPGGYRSESAEGYSYTVDTRAAAGFLTVLKDEWQLLGVGQAGQITPEHREARTPAWARMRPRWRYGRPTVGWIDGD